MSRSTKRQGAAEAAKGKEETPSVPVSGGGLTPEQAEATLDCIREVDAMVDRHLYLARAKLRVLASGGGERPVVEAIREVLIESEDIVPVGGEPFAGWSLVLAERIAAALGAVPAVSHEGELERLREALERVVVAAPDDRIATAGLWDAIAHARAALSPGAAPGQEGGAK